jgi:hypothetical protein
MKLISSGVGVAGLLGAQAILETAAGERAALKVRLVQRCRIRAS